jgi:hypothetical protein
MLAPRPASPKEQLQLRPKNRAKYDAKLEWSNAVYLMLDDFGHLGRAYLETDEEEADRETMITRLIEGQYKHPIRIVALNTSEGWSRDVTEDIAREVMMRSEGELPEATADFLDRVLGLTHRAR